MVGKNKKCMWENDVWKGVSKNSSSNMHESVTLRFVINALAQEGVRKGVSGMTRLKQTVNSGKAFLQLSRSVLDIVDRLFPLDERRTISCTKVATRVVPLWLDGKG